MCSEESESRSKRATQATESRTTFGSVQYSLLGPIIRQLEDNQLVLEGQQPEKLNCSWYCSSYS